MAQPDPESEKMSMEKVSVHGFAFGGKAVGKTSGGKVCFVRGAIPGETVFVEITADKKNFCSGTLTQIIQPSPQRQENGSELCPADCPGCSYKHIPYETELYWKEQQFRSFAEKAGLKYSDPNDFLRRIVPAPCREEYRNKIRLSLQFEKDGAVRAGYMGEDNVSLLEVKECLLAQKPIREMMRCGEWKKSLSGNEKSVTFRCTEKDGVCLFTDRGDPEHILTEKLASYGEFLVAENSFFQVDPAMADVLAQQVLRIMKDIAPGFLVELYCGCGVFSILCAEALDHLRTIGIELDKKAVTSAGRNARLHHVEDRCCFLAGDSAKVFRRKFPEGLEKGSLILVDPPRIGMDENARNLIAESKAEYLIYISCGPDTLFRDLAYLEKKSAYRIRESFPLDLFPRTSHFESITLCERI